MAGTEKKAKGYFATVPPNEIVPVVGAGHASTVKGIFVIGDVTGLPLVKIAANLATDAYQKANKK